MVIDIDTVMAIDIDMVMIASVAMVMVMVIVWTIEHHYCKNWKINISIRQ